MIYLDNAATSWPKPPPMIEAMQEFNKLVGANSGRSGHHLSVQSARIVFETRQKLSDLFHVNDPLRVVFSSNITESINLALFGILYTGDHVITTSMEHNAVMRPLRFLQKQGIYLSVIPCTEEGFFDPKEIQKHLKPNTKMIAITHASNVTGTILPIREAGRIARARNLLMLVDSAQTAGVLPIDMEADMIDLLAFTGHKSLYGPMGTGGLVIGGRVHIASFQALKMGGTGSHSEFEEQPGFLPDKYESGTLNVIGLAGLRASLAWLETQGINNILSHEQQLCQFLIDGLSSIPSVRVFGPKDASKQTAAVSFIIEGIDNGNAGKILDEEFGIQSRIGLHCAPAALKTIKAFPDGTVRFSIGFFNNHAEIEQAIDAVRNISKRIK